MTDVYEILWPGGRSMAPPQKLAPRLDTLAGKTVAELWSGTFKGDVMFPAFEQELARLYPGIRFVNWREFGEIHGEHEKEVLAALPAKLKAHGADACVTGVGGGASGAAADVRCSILAETLGLPTVTIVTDSYRTQAQLTAAGKGYPHLPFTVHPGHTLLTTDEQVRQNVAQTMTAEVIQGLTQAQTAAVGQEEPTPRQVIFAGSFEEVNQYLYEQEWSDGLPVAPPTAAKGEEFLTYTRRPAGEVLGLAEPDNRQATIWNIALNGVMAGCRPEYMPILIALVEALLDPVFEHQHLGHSPGMEELIILSGPVIKELGFNYTQGVMRPGFQANTSIGRFWRLYLRNIARFLPHKADLSCFGDGFRVVLAENEDFAASVGWPTFGADRGFAAEENVITVTSCTEKTQAIQVGAPTAEGVLTNIEKRMADNNLFIEFFFRGMRTKPLVVLPPNVARVLAAAGYTKEKVKQHFFEHARVRLNRLGSAALTRFHQGIDAGLWPELIGASHDENRLVQMVSCPEDFQIVVSGDTGRDHVLICSQNGFIGCPVSKTITLPEDWSARMTGV
jgi:hypothetical protein